MRTTCRDLRSGKFSPVDTAARLGPRHPSATELHTSYHSFRYNHSDQIDVTWTSLSVPAFWCRRRYCPAKMDRLAMECRYRCAVRVAIEGEFHLRNRDLVGFVCAVHEERHQSGGSTLNSFRSETLRRAIAYKFLVALGQFDWIS